MELFNKVKNKLGMLALFGLLFQLTMPVYQTYVFATNEGTEAQENVVEIPDENLEEEILNNPDINSQEDEVEVPDVENEEKSGENSEVSEDTDIETPDEALDEEEIIEDETEHEEEASEAVLEEVEGNTSNVEAASMEQLAETDEKAGFVLKLGSVTDLDGNAFDKENPLDLKSEFKLRLNWDLQNGHNYKKGDQVVFGLPAGIKIEKDIPIELKDKDTDLVVANAVVKPSGEVEMTFTDFVESNSNVTGWMEIISTIDEGSAGVEDSEIILQPISDEGNLTIPVDLGKREKTIEKQGRPNKGYNADEINWEVIINKMKVDLKNAELTDALPEGTVYKTSSLKVTKIKVGLNGNVLEDIEEVSIADETVKDGTLTIPLGDIKDAYRIEYITTVTDDEQKTFKNNVTLSDKHLDDISAHATATIKRGEALKKSSGDYDAKSKTISWTVEFNYNGKDLKGVNFTDSWEPSGMLDYVEGSLKFQEMTIDENGKATSVGEATSEIPGGGTVELVTDGFKINGISTEKPYKITYKTKLKDRVIDSIDVENTAKFGDESKTAVTNIGQFVGKKSAGSINYADKTIDWTIRMNQDKQLMKNISLVDTLGSGLTLDKSTIEITVGGVSYDQVKHGNYTVSDPNLDNEFTISFPDGYETDKEIVITYSTKYDADKLEINTKNQRKRATNGVLIKWMDEKGEGKEKKVGAGKDLNEDTMNNHWKNGSYNPETKEITWTIYTNYRENQIGDLKIEDIPQGNQKIIADSAIVTELEVLSNGKMKDIKELDDNISAIDTEENLLTVNIGTTNKAYRIQYKTSLKGLSDIQKEYINKAKVLDDDKTLSEIDAKVGIAKAHIYGAKSGQQEGKQVHWAVTVNPGQQRVKNLKLEDTVSGNQEILTDTFKVYEANVDIDGNATKKGEPISGDLYKLTHVEGESTFTVEWNETVERAFIVEYSSLFFEKHGGKVTNTYEVTGENIVDGATTGATGEVKIEQLGSGGASGEAGYLIIDKVDITEIDDGSQKLGGATFDLIDADTEKVLKTATTDENGTIDFGRLLYGKYKLVETKTPEGYVTKIDDYDDDGYEIEIATPYTKGEEATKIKHRVENFKPVFEIELIKTGAQGPLAGVEFALYDSKADDAEPIQASQITNNEGKILFKGLSGAGTYYVQEKSVPKEYQLDPAKYEIEVGKKERIPVKFELTNKVREGEVDVSGQKEWIDGESTERPTEIEVMLTRTLKENAEKVDTDFSQTQTVKVDSAGEWKYEFKKLDQYNALGEEYKYIVEEKAVPGYLVKKDGHDLINIQTRDVSGTKTWSGGSPSSRPDSIKVYLLANGEMVGTVKEVTEEDGWAYTFEGLPKYDLAGEEITYSINEENVPGYRKTIDGFDITNTREVYVPPTTSISGIKSWKDGDGADRPESITVNLLRNNEILDSSEVTADNNWAYSFINLEKYDSAGKAYTYTVSEEQVPGYISIIKGTDITNTRSEQTAIEITKDWLDDDSQVRPTSIEVDVYQNNELFETVKLTAEDNWRYELSDLEVYDADGEAYVYTVEEQVVKGYESVVNDFNITNRRTGVTSVTGEKTWKDEGSENRPESIEVKVTREVKGELDTEFSQTQTVTADAEGKWLYTFDELPAFNEDGVAYDYLIEEVNVPEGYESIVEGYYMTNLRVGTITVNVEKNWINDTEAVRPKTIDVDLLQNGEVIKTIQLSETTGWKYTFADLEEFDSEGKVYEYTVKEKLVKGYRVSLEKTDAGFEITNRYLRPGEVEDDKKPDEPTEDENGSKPKPNKPGQGGVEGSERPQGPQDGVEGYYTADGVWLPKTGETNNLGLYLIGGLLIFGGLVLNRKRIEE